MAIQAKFGKPREGMSFEVPALVPVGAVVERLPLQSPLPGFPSGEGLSFEEYSPELLEAWERYQALQKLRSIQGTMQTMPPCAARDVLHRELIRLEFETGLRQMALFT